MLLKVKRALQSLRRVLKSQKGFTMIELAVVLAIIALLAGLAVPTYANMRNKAYQAEANTKIQEIRADAWSYYVEHNEWPTNLSVDDTKYWSYETKVENNNFIITATPATDSPATGTVTGKVDTNGKIELTYTK